VIVPPATPSQHAPEVPPQVRARATRLLLWYPPTWRARYGEEFAELLAAELSAQPNCLRRTADVVVSGLRARLADASLVSHPLDQESAVRAGLATLACSGGVFATFGTALWSQLAIGLQWAVPDNRGITQAADLMSLALAVSCVVAVLGVAGLIRATAVAVARGQGKPLLRPAAMAIVSAAVLFVGGRHFANAWPGTGGHLLAAQGLVPGGVAAFCWATTMWITSYWAHPAMLAAFPATQIAWMTLTPLAACGLMTGVARLMRRLDRSPRALRYETWLGRVAGAGMLLFLSGILRWLSSEAAGQRPAFHAGSVDLAGLAVLMLVVASGLRALRRAGLARRVLAGR
jgi:hypothetical protein